MAFEILELGRIAPGRSRWSMGATELLELGVLRLGSPVLDVFRTIEYLEDPLAGVMLEPGDQISARERAIADKLRTLSKLQRKNLSIESTVHGYSMGEITEESQHLAGILNGIVLGKKKRGFRGIIRKITKVVKSPAFLSAMAIVVNIVPGIGQIASVGFAAAAASRKAYEQKITQKKARKAMKAEDAAAASQAAAADQAQLDAYYNQYGPTYLIPLGYTPEVWTKLTTPQKRDTLNQLVAGTLPQYVDPALKAQQATMDRQTQVDTVAMSIAMRQVYGSSLAGQGFDLTKIPADIVADAQKKVPDIVNQINAVGKDNFMAAAVKTVGQVGAVGEVYKGTGAAPPPEIAGAVELLEKGGGDVKKAIDAGKQDLLNSAAMDGQSGTISAAFKAAEIGFPYIPVLAGVAATTITAIVLLKVL